MPLPIASLLTVDLQLRNLPRDLPEHEKQRLIALTAINHLGSLGRITSLLSAIKIKNDTFEYPGDKELLEELDAGLFTLGEIQACFADSAYCAVEEMFTALNEPPPDESETASESAAQSETVNKPASVESGPSQEPPPVIETKARRQTKSGRTKTSQQFRNSTTGRYVSQHV